MKIFKNKNEVSKSLLKHKTLIIAVFFLLVSLFANAYLVYVIKKPIKDPRDLNINTTKSISQIEGYLDSISPSYLADEQSLAKQYNIPSWGCGPSSYALAEILNKKFFNNKFPINAAYDSNEPYQIVERFSLHQEGNEVGDHNWLEIYFKDQFLFVDPSIGQFGHINKIAYEQFTAGDTSIPGTLKAKYGIIDLRLSLLIQKTVNRVPASSDPYPGVYIDSNLVSYYMGVYDDRNDVANHVIPADWKDWVSFLVNKYS